MSDLPKIAILFLTYKRTGMALKTIQSTCKNLNYPKELLSFYVADDGSPKEHVDSIIECIQDLGIHILGGHNKRMRHPGQEDTHHSGLGWNLGLGLCHQATDYVLVEEDDWELDEPLDMEHYIRVMQRREEIGLMSFRILSVGADVHTVSEDGEIFLRYLRTTQYAYSGNPHIRHARFTKAYGWFSEDRNPGNIELHQDDQYRLATEGPEIWRPYTISQWGAWKHIGDVPTWRAE